MEDTPGTKPRKPRQPRIALKKGPRPGKGQVYLPAAQRRPEVLRLRLIGCQPHEIAIKLNVKLCVVRDDLNLLMREAQDISPERDEMRCLQQMQLNKLWEALQAAINAGDVPGINVALKVLERQAKLFGLDKDKNATVTVTASGGWDHILRNPTPAAALGFSEEDVIDA